MSGKQYRQAARISPKEREFISRYGTNVMKKLVKDGDIAYEKKHYFTEAQLHRDAQEAIAEITPNGKRLQDLESKKCYGYNSALIHKPSLYSTGFKLGYSFDEMTYGIDHGSWYEYQIHSDLKSQFKKIYPESDYEPLSRNKSYYNSSDSQHHSTAYESYSGHNSSIGNKQYSDSTSVTIDGVTYSELTWDPV